MELQPLRKSFSYVEPCIRKWEHSRSTRKLAIQGVSIIQNDKGPILSPPPSLEIISKNYDLLKGFTAHMAEQGVIVTRLLPPIQKSVIAFYELMERDVSSDQAKTVCHQVAKSLKKMLRVIRSKWQRWEMPRVPQLPTMTSSFPICLQCCTCCPKYLVWIFPCIPIKPFRTRKSETWWWMCQWLQQEPQKNLDSRYEFFTL